jgi:hypothetical protein
MHDKFRVRYRVPAASMRLRQQIALEAARRLLGTIAPGDAELGLESLESLGSSELYLAKRKAAAVLGHRIRPGDLPSDSEVRAQLIALVRDGRGRQDPPEAMPEPEEDRPPASLAEHLDRFAVYKMRLEPLEALKQNPRYHPEGDALYHSLQVFHLARETRPYDEEFLLAALLHDVGKAIDPQDHERAAVAALRGAVTERTLWLIAHHSDLGAGRERALSARSRRELESSDLFEDLKLLRELDDAGRVPGFVVESLDVALAFIKTLDEESYLET